MNTSSGGRRVAGMFPAQYLIDVMLTVLYRDGLYLARRNGKGFIIKASWILGLEGLQPLCEAITVQIRVDCVSSGETTLRMERAVDAVDNLPSA